MIWLRKLLSLALVVSLALAPVPVSSGSLTLLGAGSFSAPAADVTAPTITSSNSASVAENATLSHALTADEAVTWSLTGGADQADFDISGSTLRWVGNITRDYEAPADADTNNTYVVQVTATDGSSNASNQTITVTVTDESEGAVSWSDEVFKAQPFTATAAAGNAVNTGLDFSTGAGLVWLSNRSQSISRMYDTVRGVNKPIAPSSNIAEESKTDHLTSFDVTGFTMGADAGGNSVNTNNTQSIMSWSFLNNSRFFKAIGYTGNGTTQTINPAMDAGVTIGAVFTKRRASTGAWSVWHRSIASGNYAVLNTTAVPVNTTAVNFFGNNTITVDPTVSAITVGSNAAINANTATYITYVFAHDTAADGIVYCGTFTGNTSVNIGWEPQWIITKRIDSTGDWRIMDTARNWGVGNDHVAEVVTSGADITNTDFGAPTATGFDTLNFTGDHLYCAVRKPPP